MLLYKLLRRNFSNLLFCTARQIYRQLAITELVVLSETWLALTTGPSLCMMAECHSCVTLNGDGPLCTDVVYLCMYVCMYVQYVCMYVSMCVCVMGEFM